MCEDQIKLTISCDPAALGKLSKLPEYHPGWPITRFIVNMPSAACSALVRSLSIALKKGIKISLCIRLPPKVYSPDNYFSDEIESDNTPRKICNSGVTLANQGTGHYERM